MRAPDYTTPEMWETALPLAHIYPALLTGAGASNRCCFLYTGILIVFVIPATKQCWIAGMEILSRDQPFQSWWSTWGIYCKPTSVRYMNCILWLLKPLAESVLSCQPPQHSVVGYCLLALSGSLVFFYHSCYWPAVGSLSSREWIVVWRSQRLCCGNQKPLCPASKASHDTTAVVAGELLAQAQFPALLLMSLHAADVFQQVAPVYLTVPKMVISVCVRVWAAVLSMAILENKDTRTSLPVSSCMQINVLMKDLCAGIAKRAHCNQVGTWASLPTSPSCGFLFSCYGSGQGQGNRCEPTEWRRMDLAVCSPVRQTLPF